MVHSIKLLYQQAQMLPLDIDQVDLIFQAAVFAVMLSGHPRFRLFKALKNHGWIMVIATVLNTASILVVMIPLAFVERTDIPYAMLDAHPFLFIVHAAVGALAWAAALVVSSRWVLTRDVRRCYSRLAMRITFALWIASFTLGAATYLIHFLPISTL